MPNGTVDTRAAMQRLIDAARCGRSGEPAIAEFKRIHKEWLEAVGGNSVGQEQVRQAVRWLWQFGLPEASKADSTISQALERTIDALRACPDEG